MFYVYILTNRKHGTLYTGVTNDLAARIWQHRSGFGSQFVWKHRLFRLVCVQTFATALEAIAEEKRLKRWQRPWKIQLIEQANPDWRDLYDDLLMDGRPRDRSPVTPASSPRRAGPEPAPTQRPGSMLAERRVDPGSA